MRKGLLDQEMAKRSFDVVRPAILRMMQIGAMKRNTLHLVLLNPAVPFDPKLNIEDAIIHEETIGDPSTTWERDYRSLARGKVWLSWRTKMTSRMVVELYPELLLPLDTLYAGSAVYQGNIIAAASGVESHFDEMFAGMLVVAAHGLIMEKIAAIKSDPSAAIL